MRTKKKVLRLEVELDRVGLKGVYWSPEHYSEHVVSVVVVKLGVNWSFSLGCRCKCDIREIELASVEEREAGYIA
jgi:hypothetical protein